MAKNCEGMVPTVFHTSLSQRALVHRKGCCSHPDEIDIMSIIPTFIHMQFKMKLYIQKKNVHVPNGCQFFQEP